VLPLPEPAEPAIWEGSAARSPEGRGRTGVGSSFEIPSDLNPSVARAQLVLNSDLNPILARGQLEGLEIGSSPCPRVARDGDGGEGGRGEN
jgi:hypothetical protein